MATGRQAQAQAGAGVAGAEGDQTAAWLAAAEEARRRFAPGGVLAREQWRELSIMEAFQAMLRGEAPAAPIAEVLDYFPVTFEPGVAVFQGTPQPSHYNPMGTVHGGYITTLLDSAMFCAVATLLPKGVGATSLELKVNFSRPITDKTGPVRAEGKTVSVGKQIGIAEGRLVDARGNLLAFATTTCLIFPM